jgi:hypothetical protein
VTASLRSPWKDDQGADQPYLGPGPWGHFPLAIAEDLLRCAFELGNRWNTETRPGTVSQASAGCRETHARWTGFLVRAVAAAQASSARASYPAAAIAPAQLPAGLNADEITTAAAAREFGHSASWWRELAASETVRARKTSRDTWLLQRADVIAYTKGEIRRGHASTRGAA